MNGYGIPSWIKIEEYKNYFVTISSKPEEDGGMYLRLMKLNPLIPSGVEMIGRLTTTSPCKSVSAGNFMGDMGIIAGGMEDGTVMIWDVATISHEGDTVANRTQSTALLSIQEVHEGSSINTIQFNPNIQNLIASGGAEVLIQDIQENVEEPNVFTPGEPNFHEGAVITAISWNKTVPYILASAANNGSVVVWDLKNSKAIFNFKDPNLATYAYDPFTSGAENQVTANYNIIWSPETPTQFLISNDIDGSPMTLWDLRKTDTPIVTISGIDTSGVLTTAWCPHDHKIVASSSLEGKTSFFHTQSGDLLSEVKDGRSYTHLEWSPFNRGLLLGHTTSNETHIIDFHATSNKSEVADTHYAPKWLSRPLGARFGFGGKLVTFSENPEEPIKVFQTQVTPEIGQKLTDLDESLKNTEVTEIIDKFISQSANEIERIEWVTIRSL